MKLWRVLILVPLAVVQLAVPASMIYQREVVLRTGHAYKFKTAPVDPYDAFRGRYVALAFEPLHAPRPAGEALDIGDDVYAVLDADEQGFARVVALFLKPPEGDNYVRMKVDYPWNQPEPRPESEVQVRLPIDRYYMNEDTAPAAEQAYREHSRQQQHDAYVTVRVKAGEAVLEELYVDDIPMREFIRRQAVIEEPKP